MRLHRACATVPANVRGLFGFSAVYGWHAEEFSAGCPRNEPGVDSRNANSGCKSDAERACQATQLGYFVRTGAILR